MPRLNVRLRWNRVVSAIDTSISRCFNEGVLSLTLLMSWESPAPVPSGNEENSQSLAAEAATESTTVEVHAEDLHWEQDPEYPPLVVAFDAPVPEWYREQGYDETDRRRPAVFVDTDPSGKTIYRAATYYVGAMGIQRDRGFETLEEAKEEALKEWPEFLSSTGVPWRRLPPPSKRD